MRPEPAASTFRNSTPSSFEEADEHRQHGGVAHRIDVAAPDDEAVNAVFRAAHSIKGGAGMFGFKDVTDLTHEGGDAARPRPQG